MLILHDMHLSCCTNFPVLYKINKTMPVVSSSLTLIHCDFNTLEYCRDRPGVLPNFPFWAISESYDLFIILISLLAIDLLYSNFQKNHAPILDCWK